MPTEFEILQELHRRKELPDSERPRFEALINEELGKLGEAPAAAAPAADARGLGSQFASNLLPSLGKLIKNTVMPPARDIAGAFKGAVSGQRSPSELLSGPATLMLGLQQKLFPGLAGIQQAGGVPNAVPALTAFAKPITESIANPAGVPRRAAEFTAKDPAQALANMSLLLGGVGKIPGVSPAIGKAATAIDPINAALTAGGAVAKPLGSLGRMVGGFTTGKRTPMLDQLYNTFKAGGDIADKARKYLRGKLEAEDAIGEYKGALKSVRDKQLDTYTSRLKALENDTTTVIDPTSLKNELTKKLYDYGVTAWKKGQLDFSRSKAFAADGAAQADVKRITEIIRGWGKKPGDTSPFQMDTLRGILDSFYSPSGKAREFAASMKGIVKEEIIKKVPEYKDMISGYETSQKMFEESKKLFSMSNPNDRRVNADLVLKKLQRAMTEDPEYARNFIGELENASGKDIKSIVAGYSMAPAMPGGIVGRGMLGGSLYEAGRKGIAQFDPHLALMMGAASPRIVGEFLNATAKVSSAAEKGADIVKATTVPRQIVESLGALSESQKKRRSLSE